MAFDAPSSCKHVGPPPLFFSCSLVCRPCSPCPTPRHSPTTVFPKLFALFLRLAQSIRRIVGEGRPKRGRAGSGREEGEGRSGQRRRCTGRGGGAQGRAGPHEGGPRKVCCSRRGASFPIALCRLFMAITLSDFCRPYFVQVLYMYHESPPAPGVR